MQRFSESNSIIISFIHYNKIKYISLNSLVLLPVHFWMELAKIHSAKTPYTPFPYLEWVYPLIRPQLNIGSTGRPTTLLTIKRFSASCFKGRSSVKIFLLKLKISFLPYPEYRTPSPSVTSIPFVSCLYLY